MTNHQSLTANHRGEIKSCDSIGYSRGAEEFARVRTPSQSKGGCHSTRRTVRYYTQRVALCCSELRREDLMLDNYRNRTSSHPSRPQAPLPSSVLPQLASCPQAYLAAKRINCVVNELLETEVSYLASLREIKELASCPQAYLAAKRINCVVNELLETEVSYLASLREIKEGYWEPLSTSQKHEQSTLETIFSNIVPLHRFHSEFSAELSRGQEDLLGIGEAFLRRAVDFETLYVEFCTKHSRSIQALEKEIQLQTELCSDIFTCQSALGHILPLATYLLKPVQRVLKYQLLLQELVKGCKSAAADLISDATLPTSFESGLKDTIECLQAALERMIQVASHINEEKRRRELIDQLRVAGLDVDGWGRLRLRDVFRLPAKKDAWRLALLFDRAILLCKPTTSRTLAAHHRVVTTQVDDLCYAGAAGAIAETGSVPNLAESGGGRRSVGNERTTMLEIREFIDCSNLMLIECIDKNPLAFHILPFGNPKAQRTLQAASMEVKHLWCQEIKRVILENFDAAIPEKAKHLVLHLEEFNGKAYEKLFEAAAAAATSTTPWKCRAASEDDVSPPRRRSVDTCDHEAQLRVSLASAHNGSHSSASLLAPETAGASSVYALQSNHASPDSENVALIHDAWNALLAKHATASAPPVPVPAGSSLLGEVKTTSSPNLFIRSNSALAGTTTLTGGGEAGGTAVLDDDDFRCIAVEINEERFSVSTPLPNPQSDSCLFDHQTAMTAATMKTASPSARRKTSAQPTFRASPVAQNGSSGHSHESARRKLHGKGKSLYINCQEASEYDTVTFGRAYEQYIEKTRAMSTISAGELDEILRPLLTLRDQTPTPPRPRRVQSRHGETTPRPLALTNGNANKLPTAAPPPPSSSPKSRVRQVEIGRSPQAPYATSESSCSSGGVSPCQIVSRIAIDTSVAKSASTIPSRKSAPAPLPPTNSKSDSISRPQNNSVNTASKNAPKPSIPKPAPDRSGRHTPRNCTSVSASLPKPPRSGSNSKPGSLPSLHCQNKGIVARTNGYSSTASPSKTVYGRPSSAVTAAAAGGEKNSEAVSLCRGRVRAAVETLLQPDQVPNQLAPRPLRKVQASVPPGSPAKTVHGPNKPPRTSSSNAARSTASPADIGEVRELRRGHVQGLINRFQH
ncbi:Pleckstrin y domain-containing G member 1 [Sparganum proliferum]